MTPLRSGTQSTLRANCKETSRRHAAKPPTHSPTFKGSYAELKSTSASPPYTPLASPPEVPRLRLRPLNRHLVPDAQTSDRPPAHPNCALLGFYSVHLRSLALGSFPLPRLAPTSTFTLPSRIDLGSASVSDCSPARPRTSPRFALGPTSPPATVRAVCCDCLGFDSRPNRPSNRVAALRFALRSAHHHHPPSARQPSFSCAPH